MACLLGLEGVEVIRRSSVNLTWTECASAAIQLNRFSRQRGSPVRWIVDSPTMFSCVSAGDRFIWANDYLLGTHGISLSDLRRHRVTDFVVPSSHSELLRRSKLLADGVDHSPVARYTIDAKGGQFEAVFKTVDTWRLDGEPVRHFAGSVVRPRRDRCVVLIRRLDTGLVVRVATNDASHSYSVAFCDQYNADARDTVAEIAS